MSRYTINGKPYDLVFTNAALREVVRRFGGVEEMGQKMQENQAEAVDHVFWLVSVLANQGTMLATGNTKPNNPELIDADFVAVYTKPHEISALSDAMNRAIAEGMNMEYTESGPVDVVLQELREEERKNGESGEG